jgi:ketosteroid isomerase-like protein
MSVAKSDGEIRNLYDIFEQIINGGSPAELIGAFFTHDATVAGHMIPVIKGGANIPGFFAQVQQGFKDIVIESIETTEGNGDVVYNIANTRMTERASGKASILRSLCIFRQTQQGLRCELDFFAQAEG